MLGLSDFVSIHKFIVPLKVKQAVWTRSVTAPALGARARNLDVRPRIRDVLGLQLFMMMMMMMVMVMMMMIFGQKSRRFRIDIVYSSFNTFRMQF